MKVAIVTQDVIGARLAGPAIRALAMARVLAEHGHEVRVHSVHAADHPSPLVVAGRLRADVGKQVVRRSDVIVVQGDVLDVLPGLQARAGSLVCDLYNAAQLEGLVRGVSLPESARYAATRRALAVVSEQLALGDLFLCSSERQRQLWLGHLDSAGRVNPANHDADPTLRSLLTIVPFGIDDHPPVRTGAGLRTTLPGLDASSRIVLWGGGIYDWLDPLPAIEAVVRLHREIPEVRLVFMGTVHPNPAVPASTMLERARDLVRSLGAEEVVLFHDGWVPHDERQNLLLDAEVGVSGHPDHIETTFAYRTRVLDYLWAGLPVVATTGDALGDLIEREHLGATVPPGSADAVHDALRRLLADPHEATRVRERVTALAPQLRWSVVLEPLVAHCARPTRAPDLEVGAARRLRHHRRPAGRRRAAELREGVEAAWLILRREGPAGLVRRARRRVLAR